MKKSKEIIGLAVVSIQEGKELGTVRQLLVDAGQGTVAALLVDDCEWYFGAKLLPFSGVNAVGENAVTINSENDITPVAKISDFDSLLKNNVSIIGSTVITITGNVIGTVVEILVDTDGKIAGCQIDTADENSPIPAKQVITFGRDALIVSLDGELPLKKLPKPAASIDEADCLKEPVEEAVAQVVEETVEAAVEEAQPGSETSIEPAVEEAVPVEVLVNSVIEELAQPSEEAPVEPAVEQQAAALPVESVATEPTIEKTAQPVEPVVELTVQPFQPSAPETIRTIEEPVAKPAPAAPAGNENDALAKMFEEKQRRYLLGKKANRLIQSDSGVTIIEPGEEITEAVLQKAKLAGKFLELSMSVH